MSATDENVQRLVLSGAVQNIKHTGPNPLENKYLSAQNACDHRYIFNALMLVNQYRSIKIVFFHIVFSL